MVPSQKGSGQGDQAQLKAPPRQELGRGQGEKGAGLGGSSLLTRVPQWLEDPPANAPGLEVMMSLGTLGNKKSFLLKYTTEIHTIPDDYILKSCSFLFNTINMSLKIM